MFARQGSSRPVCYLREFATPENRLNTHVFLNIFIHFFLNIFPSLNTKRLMLCHPPPPSSVVNSLLIFLVFVYLFNDSFGFHVFLLHPGLPAATPRALISYCCCSQSCSHSHSDSPVVARARRPLRDGCDGRAAVERRTRDAAVLATSVLRGAAPAPGKRAERERAPARRHLR